jgi:predicted nucleotidyltransferase
MNTTEKRILDTFKTLLLQRVKVHTLVLFGSRARGDADPASDMDVLVVVEDVDSTVENYISDCAWEAGFEHGIVVVPVVFSHEEWEHGLERHSLLAKAIRAEGIVL